MSFGKQKEKDSVMASGTELSFASIFEIWYFFVLDIPMSRQARAYEVLEIAA